MTVNEKTNLNENFREKELTKLIPIVADVPSENPGLGFPEIAEALADAIRGGVPPQFTVGLYGAWGSGKSSLLNSIYNNLSSANSNVTPVKFNAWRYEKSEYIIVPLLHEIYSTVRKSGNKKVGDFLKRALKSIVYSLNFKLDVMGLGFNAKHLMDFWEKKGLIPLDNAFTKPFFELREISKALGGKRIAILIDDLDRCSPKNVVSVIESINLVMDIPGFIFVLALDYNVLKEAVTEKYPHVSGDVFIEKIIQVPYPVPPLNVKSPEFLDELIPGWSEKWTFKIPNKFSDHIKDIASLGLKANPRQIKRLINSFLLSRRILEERDQKVDDQLLMSFIGFQLLWPSDALDLKNSVFAGEDQYPLEDIKADEGDPDLARYAKRFFKNQISISTLKLLLQVTAVVVLEEKSKEKFTPRTPRKLKKEEFKPRTPRELKREEFIRKLIERGFEKSTRSNRLYYKPGMPKKIRFVLGKNVARFEKKHKGGWKHWESYLFTRETELALKVIENPRKHFKNLQEI